jgi:WD40 repeat protein
MPLIRRPHGKYLVLYNGPNYSLREVATGKQLFKYLTPATASIYAASFSPDGNYWLVGSISSPGSGLNLGILSVKTGEVRANLQHISQYKWNPAGDKLEYLPLPGTKSVFILDFTAPQSIPIELFQGTGVLDVLWSPDGKTLLILGTDYTLRRYSNDIAEVLALAKNRLFTQQLTPEQLNQYLRVGVTTSSPPTLTPQP